MTTDTIFDIASLTKVVATAPAVLQLVEDGRLRLSDRASTFIPAFGRYGKDRITIQDLLTHMSGLRPDVDLTDEWTGYDTAIQRAIEEVPAAAPGQRFIYSDINFFLLAEIVARVSGQPFEVVAKTRIFDRLGMRDTMFRAGWYRSTNRPDAAGRPAWRRTRSRLPVAWTAWPDTRGSSAPAEPMARLPDVARWRHSRGVRGTLATRGSPDDISGHATH